MDNNLKGLFYEKQIKDYIYKKFNKISYLWKETPELILINAGIIECHRDAKLMRKINSKDTGIDIFQLDYDIITANNIINQILDLNDTDDVDNDNENKNNINSGVSFHK